MRVRVWILLSFVLALAVVAEARQHRSAIRGILLDGELRPAAGILMQITHEPTGRTREFSSDDRGHFAIVQLEPGSYRISARDDRYKTFGARVLLGTGETRDVRWPLTLEAVTALDIRPFLLYADAGPARTTRLAGDFIAELPLDGRDVLNAAALTPGIATVRSGLFHSGTGPGATGYWLDGFLTIDPLLATALVEPPIDAVAHLDVATPSLDAAFGRAPGAHVSIATRSGTNRFGGSFGLLHQADRDRWNVFGHAGGPLVSNRTFFFAGLDSRRFEDLDGSGLNPYRGNARIDQNLGGGGLLMGRYTRSDAGDAFGSTGDHFGAALTTFFGGSAANDLRIGFGRASYDLFTINSPNALSTIAMADSRLLQVSDTVSWTRGASTMKAGFDWIRTQSGLTIDEDEFGQAGGFLQADWRASNALSLFTGVRYERHDFDERGSRQSVSPRAGFAWTVGPEGMYLLRGGYGRYYNQQAGFEPRPSYDQWNVGGLRQWGRTRTVELSYVGGRVGDVPTFGATRGESRYGAITFEMRQRSDTGINGHLAYTYGRSRATDVTGALGRSPHDARHKLTGAFHSWLPIGDERRFLSKGMTGEILKDIQLAGVFAYVTGRPLRDGSGRQDAGYRTLNLALSKNWRMERERRLELRIEMLNATGRSNPDPLLFQPDHGRFLFEAPGRRYQFGGKFWF